MSRQWGRWLAIAAVLAGMLGSAMSGMAEQAPETGRLTLRRVMLSTGGVGYFEYEARIDGAADLSLPVRLDQVDDVLKSIVVYDDRGGIGEISLPGQEPLREVFRELPFGPDALGSPVALLNALRGAEVRAIGTRQVQGRLLSVIQETVGLPDGGSTARHRISLMTPEGLRQLILEETDGLQFADPALQQQVDAALAALAQHSQRDRRTLSVRLTGEGERTVRVGYVVGVPLWKTAYRLTLSDNIEDHAGTLQGWAVVENLTGEDWTEVELTAVSGNPVTFRQALYQAYYVERPEVPVEVLGRILPRPDQGGRPADGRDDGVRAELEESVRRGPGVPQAPRAAMGALGGAVMAPAPMEPSPSTMAEMAPPAPPPAQAEITAAASTEATTQVMFRFPRPVSVANGHSLLVPMVSRTVPVDRVALYQPGTHPLHPLATVRLTNDGDTGLPPGVLTLYERSAANGIVSYLGDARLGVLPAGEPRLISFALDQKLRIERQDQGAQRITQAALADGLLRLTMTERSAATYTITGAAREARVVMIEHPRMNGWTLIEPAAAAVEVTPDQYRIRRPVAAGAVETVTVVMERPRHQRFELASMTTSQIEFYAASTELSQEIRTALAHLREFQANIGDRERTLRALEGEESGLVTDQDRIRRNLGSVPRDSDLYQRYLGMLTSQEDRLEQLRRQIAEVRAGIVAARQALVEYARSLRL